MQDMRFVCIMAMSVFPYGIHQSCTKYKKCDAVKSGKNHAAQLKYKGPVHGATSKQNSHKHKCPTEQRSTRKVYHDLLARETPLTVYVILRIMLEVTSKLDGE